MNICVIDGNSKVDNPLFEERLNALLVAFAEAGHKITKWSIEDMNLRFCNGCWVCWTKKPGLCVFDDGVDKIYRSYLSSDLVIFASPLIYGFTSAQLKKITDRLIALIHPYIFQIEGECHHEPRYLKYPEFGLILMKEEDSDEEDIEIVRNIYKRISISLHSEMKFMQWIENPIEEVIDECCSN